MTIIHDTAHRSPGTLELLSDLRTLHPIFMQLPHQFNIMISQPGIRMRLTTAPLLGYDDAGEERVEEVSDEEI